MTIKRKLFTSYLHVFMSAFRLKKFRNTLHLHCNADRQPEGSIDLITIAYNQAYLIEQQIRLVKRHLQDPGLTHIIADNSTDPRTRKAIQDLCRREKVAYISLPFNPIHRGCYSHGAALNWVYYNLIRLRQPRYFGFIDHDIFPTRPYSIAGHLKGLDFYGEKRMYPYGWYLWAGFCFFDFEKTKTYKFDFFPCMLSGGYLDTGGSNYTAFYSRYAAPERHFCPSQPIKTGEGNDYHNDFVQRIDHAWIHAIAGGSIQDVPSKRDFMNRLFAQDGNIPD